MSISLQNVSRSFADRSGQTIAALENVSMEIENGTIAALIGPSGCGKTTILNLVAGFDAPTSGAVLSEGVPIRSPGPDRSVVFQAAALFPWMTVWENVVIGPKRGKKRVSEYTPLAEELIEAVGLTRFAKHYPYQLSGGMQQRVQIARSLVATPDVLLMDEPFGALDYQTRLDMQELLLRLQVKFSATVLFITHDVQEAVFVADRVFAMKARPGRVDRVVRVPFESPRTFELVTDPAFARLEEELLHVIKGTSDTAA